MNRLVWGICWQYRLFMSQRTRLLFLQTNLLRMLLVGIVSVISFCILSCGDRKIEIKWKQIQSHEIEKPLLRVYIENSGSMDGFMCDGSELKDAIYGYISRLSSFSDSIELNYINSQIIPYKKELRTFIRNLTPISFHSAGGNTGSSDIADMFEKILSDTDDNIVSIFVSDCILDIPGGDASKFFVNRQIDIQNAFIKQLNKCKDLSVEILRLESSFNGWYYYTHGKEFLKDARRPYYMWVIGNKNHLSRLNKNVPLSDMQHGVKNYFAYSTPSEIPCEITNKSGIKKGNTSICNLDSDGKYRFLIKTNMSVTLQDEQTICNVGNYGKLNSFVNIERIDRISAKESFYTHLLTVAIDQESVNSVGEKLSLVSFEKPDWLENANDDSGREVTMNMDKTTGIKYIVQGVADAYKSNKELAEIKFVISKK